MKRMYVAEILQTHLQRKKFPLPERKKCASAEGP